jgi:peptidoglycan/LPS O-acetylase OafA/YrhL
MRVEVSLLDVAVFFVIALALAYGVRKGAPFTLAVVPALVAYVVLAQFLPIHDNPWLSTVLAVILGMGSGALSQLVPLPRFSNMTESVIGGAGGLIWGLFLAVCVWVSFPAQYKASTGSLQYPSDRMPDLVAQSIEDSGFAQSLFAWVVENPIARRVFPPNLR